MVVTPCKRFRKYRTDRTAWRDYVVSLVDSQIWYGSPQATLSSQTRYSGHRKLKDRKRNNNHRILDGYISLDYVLVDDFGVVVLENIASEHAVKEMALSLALPYAAAASDAQQAKEGAQKPEKEMPPDPFYWELRILSRPPRLLIHDIVHTQAALVSAAMPEYTKADAQALWAMMNSEDAITSGSDTAGEIPKDGSVRTLGHLMVLWKTAIEFDARWSHYVHLALTGAQWVLQSNGELDKIAMLQAAGLNRDDKKAPATLAAIALGLLPTPIDLSGAPDDDFYL
jgi:hypothetical protein